jgi:hypothetical protein
MEANFSAAGTGLAWSEPATSYSRFQIDQISGETPPTVEHESIRSSWTHFSRPSKERVTPSVADTIEQALSSAQGLGVRLASPLIIRRFLFGNLQAAELMTFALSTLQSRLPRTSDLTIDVVHSPDSTVEELVILVRSDEYDEMFLNSLDRAREPLLSLMGSSETSMAITTDFHPTP